MNEELGRILLIAVLSYALGAIPTAYLVGRLRNINIFEVGSGNMGATNITRSMGLGWGLLVWFFDSVKGILAIILAIELMPGASAYLATTIAALASVVGHNWSVFAALITGTLRGGKGAATAFGTLLWVAPLQAVIGVAIAITIVVITRYVSLGVLVMFTLATAWMLLLAAEGSLPAIYSLYAIAIAILIAVRFRENIERLLSGTERKFGQRV